MKKSEEHIKEWIAKISEIRPELGNFAICPYSHSATYEVVEAPIDDIMPIKGCDVVIFVVEDYLDADAIQMWCEIYNTIYPEFIFWKIVLIIILFLMEFRQIMASTT